MRRLLAVGISPALGGAPLICFVSIMKRLLHQLHMSRLPAVVVGIFGLLCLISGVAVVLKEFPKRPAVAPAHWWLDHWWSDLVVTSALMFTIAAAALFLAWVVWRAPTRQLEPPK
jgi:hypothetical protein